MSAILPVPGKAGDVPITKKETRTFYGLLHPNDMFAAIPLTNQLQFIAAQNVLMDIYKRSYISSSESFIYKFARLN